MKIAAVVILYHPHDTCLTNIKSYYDAVSKIYVFDNTEEGASIKKELSGLSKIAYFHDGENHGLSKRLNEGCHLSINEGFDWLLTMDQDSHFFEGSIFKYLHCLGQYDNNQKVAMFGTTNSRNKIASTGQCGFKEANDLMTSGTILNLSLFKKIGDFDEALFIDSVDHDYCIRITLAGYKMVHLSNIFLLHEIGDEVYRSSFKTLFLIKKKKEVHSPVRFYYMYRNILYLNRKFEPYNLPQIKQLKKEVRTAIKTAIYYGRDSLKILKYLKKGYQDYKNMTMGKLKNNI